jgi:GTP-binding protein HflX
MHTEASMEELGELARSAGASVVGTVIQERVRKDPATLIGRGKVEEVARLADQSRADVLLFDDELSPAQQRNVEDMAGRKTLDRTQLILDIFARRARTREGRLQVELAQLDYLLPRLAGKGVLLSRLGGGIGTRGPGETKLETDRRRIRQRIQNVKGEIERVRRTRHTRREARQRAQAPVVALVGYTNAGKSTLLNRLTAADALVEDQLFSTLDPTTRRLPLTGGETVLLSDTVGFVRKLPHELVEAFRSTLEEVVDADLLLHVVDGSSPTAGGQIEAVREVLRDIGAAQLPELVVVNKLDVAAPDAVDDLLAAHAGAVAASAATGEGVDKLREALADRLRSLARIVELAVPYERGDVIAALHRDGEVLVEVHGDRETRVRARIPEAGVSRFADFVVG